MADENFSPEQSLKVIQSMISRTKQDMSDDSIYFLVWGWITFIGCAGQFILKNIMHYEQHYQVWLIVFAGVAFSIYYGRKESRSSRVKTYTSESMKYLWIGMGISYFVLSMILTKIGWNSPVFPFFILLYGLGTFISGCIIQFRPLITGGILAWVLAVASLWASYDYQMLFGAAAILISYIIPAYILRLRNKMQNN